MGCSLLLVSLPTSPALTPSPACLLCGISQGSATATMSLAAVLPRVQTSLVRVRMAATAMG